MRPQERRLIIMELVVRHERVSVEFLVQHLACSAETIRRDLGELAEAGIIRKFHGGAAVPDIRRIGLETEGTFLSRMHTQLEEKHSIARRAAELFGPGDTLFIDTGSTTVFFAEELSKLSNLTVITNSTLIAQSIAKGTRNKVFLVGGEYLLDSLETAGSFAMEMIARFNTEHVVLTAGAVGSEGIMDFVLDEAEVAMEMIAHAKRLTVLADSSKFGRSGLFHVCPLHAIDRLITDRLPEAALTQAFEASGVELVLAAAEVPTG